MGSLLRSVMGDLTRLRHQSEVRVKQKKNNNNDSSSIGYICELYGLILFLTLSVVILSYIWFSGNTKWTCYAKKLSQKNWQNLCSMICKKNHLTLIKSSVNYFARFFKCTLCKR